MTRYIVLLNLAWFVLGCSGREGYRPATFLTGEQERTILRQAVRYMYYSEGIPAHDRWNRIYDGKYDQALSSFELVQYAIAGGTHFFLIRRAYPGNKWRAVGGRLEVDENFRITDFEEKFVTPLLPAPELKEKAEFLFSQLASKGFVEEKHLRMGSYVEWPDATTFYDKTTHQWTTAGKL